MTRTASLALLLLLPLPALAWDFEKHGIPVDEILSGGPPRDGIPALTEPVFVSVDEASFLQAGDRVLGVAHRGAARAYPIRILSWHEVVNDTVGGDPVLVSW